METVAVADTEGVSLVVAVDVFVDSGVKDGVSEGVPTCVVVLEGEPLGVTDAEGEPLGVTDAEGELDEDHELETLAEGVTVDEGLRLGTSTVNALACTACRSVALPVAAVNPYQA